MQTIVVGLDGSDGANVALKWAADEAHRHGASLTALLVWDALRQPGGGFDPAFDEVAARAVLQRWITAEPLPVPVRTEVVLDLPAAGLVEASASNDLVVVGSRGLGGFKDLLLGSVSATVAERAVGPVAVVRDGGDANGPVVVGVDESSFAARALRWAVDEALARDVPLELVHTWSGGGAPVLGLPYVVPQEDAIAAAESELTAAMKAVDLSSVTVNRRVIKGTPAGVLVDLSATASVVVVGSRGRGALTSILLGSTSRHLLHHAACPVVVIR